MDFKFLKTTLARLHLPAFVFFAATLIVTATMPSDLRAQSATPGVNIPQLAQVQLTKAEAMNALRAFKELKTRFKDQVPPGSDARAFAMAMTASATIKTVLDGYGFADTAIWQKTLISLLLANNATEGDNAEKMRRSLQQMRDNKSIPEATKNQLIAQMQAFLPSEGNVEVAKSVADDPEGAELIAYIKN